MKYKIHRGLIVLAFAKACLMITSCNNTSQVEQEIAAIPMETELYLFHEEFGKAMPEDLPQLKRDYPSLFPKYFPDSLWIAKMTGKDTVQTVLEEAIEKKDFNYEAIQTDVEDVFKHVEYYFPEFETPDVVTVISEVDYRRKIIPTQQQLFIAIDTYLGKNHELYNGISDYRRENLDISNLKADVALAHAHLFVEPSLDRTLLGSMVYYGKLHYLQELFAPQSNGPQLFSIAPEKYEFAVNNESQMWSFLVDESLLYSTDSKLQSRFILPAPFSKFYLEIDQYTPGGVGKYIGYRIVKAYMENNDTSLEDMISLPADVIFNKSKFKPKQ